MSRNNEYKDRVDRATTLVEQFPPSALIDFLASNFDTAALEAEIERCCTRHGQVFPDVLYRTRSGSNPSQSSRPQLRSPVHHSSPFEGQYQSLHNPYPASPPTTHGSEYSHTRGPSSEIVLAIDGSFQRQAVSMVKANVRFNWIKADIALARLQLDVKPCELAGGYVNVPYPTIAGGTLKATQQTLLTWSRPNSDSTDQMLFYLFHERSGPDLIIGEQVRKFQAFNFFIALPNASTESETPGHVNARASVHGGNNHGAYGGTMGQTAESSYISEPVTITPSRLGLNINMGAPVDQKHQRTKDWAQQSSGAAHSPPRQQQSATPAQSQASGSSTESSVRIKVTWDGSTLPVKLNLNASGDAILTQLKKSFKKRELDRNEFLLRLSTNRDPDAPSADETMVCFSPEDLEGDWQDAVAWIRDSNRSSSGIYGKIESADTPG